jgi:hypothetical protein
VFPNIIEFPKVSSIGFLFSFLVHSDARWVVRDVNLYVAVFAENLAIIPFRMPLTRSRPSPLTLYAVTLTNLVD